MNTTQHTLEGSTQLSNTLISKETTGGILSFLRKDSKKAVSLLESDTFRNVDDINAKGIMKLSWPGLRPIPGLMIAANFFCPLVLYNEFSLHPLAKGLLRIVSETPGQLWIVSSVVHSMTGAPRESITSHYKGYSVDIAPVKSLTAPRRADGHAANLCDNVRFGTYLAPIAKEMKLSLFLEDDHIHADARGDEGVYFWVSRHTTYSDVLDHDARAMQLFEITTDGEVKRITNKAVLHKSTDNALGYSPSDYLRSLASDYDEYAPSK